MYLDNTNLSLYLDLFQCKIEGGKLCQKVRLHLQA